MSDDPMVREIGRLEDDAGRILIVGVDYDAVTLRLGGGGAVALGMGQQEELGQLLIAAVWQAGWQRRQVQEEAVAASAALAGAPPGPGATGSAAPSSAPAGPGGAAASPSPMTARSSPARRSRSSATLTPAAT